MNKPLLFTVVILLLTFNAFSQILFEDGYFINELNQKVNCLIKNIDWKDNPNEFLYKMSQNDSIRSANLKTVKEFAVYRQSKYIKANVEIDRSIDQLGYLSKKRGPVFKEEQLFLKVLIEGEGSLYLFVDENLIRFFYQLKNQEITQLVYKKYSVNGNIATNNHYKQQLYNNLNCQLTDLKYFEGVNYRKKDLEKIFISFNECKKSEYIKHNANQNKDLLNLSFRPGLNSSSLKIQNLGTDFYNIDFGKYLALRFGIETEFILPFNKNKWGIIMEPTFQYFRSEQTQEVFDAFFSTTSQYQSNIDYKSIELPIGLRHSFYLKNKSKMFVNASYTMDFAANSFIEFTKSDGSNIRDDLVIKSQPNLSIGAGYQFQTRYSMEIRYQIARDILNEYVYWQSNYNSLSIIFGWKIL